MGAKSLGGERASTERVLLSVILSFLMILSFAPVVAFADPAGDAETVATEEEESELAQNPDGQIQTAISEDDKTEASAELVFDDGDSDEYSGEISQTEADLEEEEAEESTAEEQGEAIDIQAEPTSSVSTLDELKSAVANTSFDEITLTGAITLSETLTINRTLTIKSDTPQTLTANSGRHFKVATGGNLTLNKVVLDGSSTAGGIDVDEATLTLESATIKNCVAKKEDGGTSPVYNGGAIHADHNAAVTLTGSSALNGNKAADFGGAIYATGGSGVVVGGTSTVTGNSAPGGGGISVAYSAKLTLKDSSSINGNTATLNGGGIEAVEGAEVFLSGNAAVGASSFPSNKAQQFGGGIYLDGASLELDGNSVVKSNYAVRGGGVAGGSSKASTITMNDASSISGNKSEQHGGGIGARSAAITVELNDRSAISHNEARANNGNGGGIYFLSGCTLNMSDDSAISDNSAVANGGGVYAEDSTISLADSSAINNNTASGSSGNQGGGGVYVTGGSSLKLSGAAQIRDNEAKYGGGIFILYGELTLADSCIISGNTATIHGGGIYYHDGGNSKLTITGSVRFAGNLASILYVSSYFPGDIDGDKVTGVSSITPDFAFPANYTGSRQNNNLVFNNYDINNKKPVGTSLLQAYVVSFDTGEHGNFPHKDFKDIVTGANTPTVSNPDDIVGWHFVGWNPALIDIVNDNIAYTARWEMVMCDVVYHSTEHTAGTIPSQETYQQGKFATVKGAGTLVRNGYTFLGWTTNPAATTANYVANEEITVNADVHLYAVWRQNTPTSPPAPTTPTTPTTPTSPTTPAAPAQTQPTTVAPLATTDTATSATDTSANATTTITPPATPRATSPAATSPTTPPNTQTINEGATPLAGSEGAWALLNLILTAAGILLAVVLLALHFSARRREAEANDSYSEAASKRSLGWRIAASVLAVGAIVLLLLTEDITKPMVLTDFWTVFHVVIAVLLIVASVIAILQKRAGASSIAAVRSESRVTA